MSQVVGSGTLYKEAQKLPTPPSTSSRRRHMYAFKWVLPEHTDFRGSRAKRSNLPISRRLPRVSVFARVEAASDPVDSDHVVHTGPPNGTLAGPVPETIADGRRRRPYSRQKGLVDDATRRRFSDCRSAGVDKRRPAVWSKDGIAGGATVAITRRASLQLATKRRRKRLSSCFLAATREGVDSSAVYLRRARSVRYVLRSTDSCLFL